MDGAIKIAVERGEEVKRYMARTKEEIQRLRIEAAKMDTGAIKLSFALDFAAESAKAFIAAWRDGKWVPTGNRSSRRKQGVGGKRW